MHWADFTAEKLSKERGNKQVACSGITPSGEFHIGHIREILSAEMIHRACLDSGLDSRYIFIVDSMDPLRRVYPFLSEEYEQYIGLFYSRIYFFSELSTRICLMIHNHFWKYSNFSKRI